MNSVNPHNIQPRRPTHSRCPACNPLHQSQFAAQAKHRKRSTAPKACVVCKGEKMIPVERAAAAVAVTQHVAQARTVSAQAMNTLNSDNLADATQRPAYRRQER